MITTVLVEHAALVRLALALLMLLCAAVGWWALRRGEHVTRVLWALAGLSLLPVLVLTLVPSGPVRREAGGCVVQFSLPGLGTVELLANVALFIPPVFFAALATRRLIVPVAVGSAASVLVEAVQAAVPALGRACDTNDWSMNTVGALVGVLLAVGTRTLADRSAARSAGKVRA